MAWVFERSLVIPLWVLAFCAVVVSAPMRLMPSLLMLLAIAIIASTMQAIVRWWRTSRRLVELVPAREQAPTPGAFTMVAGARSRTLEHAIEPRTLETDDTLDLVRMDDDGGWQMAQGPTR